ncbi:MAG: LysR family transcriptional regulator [Vicinamibacterales bacterium]
MAMEWLNYHHLLYFWTVVREGGVSRAAEKLRLAQPTVSAQVKLLEDTLGQQLFDRQGRRLVLTDTGRLVYRYADEIFGIGRELMEALKGRNPGRPMPLTVGVANAVPKRSCIACCSPRSRVRFPFTSSAVRTARRRCWRSSRRTSSTS